MLIKYFYLQLKTSTLLTKHLKYTSTNNNMVLVIELYNDDEFVPHFCFKSEIMNMLESNVCESETDSVSWCIKSHQSWRCIFTLFLICFNFYHSLNICIKNWMINYVCSFKMHSHRISCSAVIHLQSEYCFTYIFFSKHEVNTVSRVCFAPYNFSPSPLANNFAVSWMRTDTAMF